MFCLKIKSKIGVVNELLLVEGKTAAHFMVNGNSVMNMGIREDSNAENNLDRQ